MQRKSYHTNKLTPLCCCLGKSNVVGDKIMHSASSNKHHNQEQPNVGENAKSEEKVTAVRGDPMDDPAEQAHFRQVVGTFFFYQVSSATE